MDKAKAERAAKEQAQRWGLHEVTHFTETHRAHLFRASTDTGPVALKLYKHIGWSGEGAAIPFLKNLREGVGVRILRKDTLRAAMLLEWLEGPTLQAVANAGQSALADEKLAAVAHGVATSRFPLGFALPNVMRRMHRRLGATLAAAKDENTASILQRAFEVSSTLCRTAPKLGVIHGDLSLENVILTAKGPRLIDPKALRADPAIEFAKTLSAPAGGMTADALCDNITERSQRLCEAVDASPDRLIKWAIVELAKGLPTAPPSSERDHNRIAQVDALLALVGA